MAFEANSGSAVLVRPWLENLKLPTLSHCSLQHRWEEVQKHRLARGWVLQGICGASPLNIWSALLQPSQC